MNEDYFVSIEKKSLLIYTQYIQLNDADWVMKFYKMAYATQMFNTKELLKNDTQISWNFLKNVDISSLIEDSEVDFCE
jgi:hypothetical protein